MRRRLPSLLLGALVVACSGGDGGITGGGCTGFCATNTPTNLTVADVEQIIAQAVAEAGARGAPATIAVVDRTGNVLGVFQMNGAAATMTTDGGNGVTGGLDNITVIPSTLGAISKAITAAYLSSEGNAFSTRTASQIVQEHFYPGETGQPSGPLFGVQFSQLPCSDLSARLVPGQRPSPGPHRAPLGLSADPGGLPLYKNGTPVGGIGVMADGIYGVDRDIRNRDVNDDEVIALAGSFGFEAPADRRADRITAGGVTLRFSDARASDLESNPASAPDFGTAVDGMLGARLSVPGYMDSGDSAIVAGTFFGQSASGVSNADILFAPLDGFILDDGAGANLKPPTAGSNLTQAEVQQILANALDVANRSRAQIRRPLGTPARVSVSVVDTDGTVLGLVRTRDAPVFGIDVSLQKARTALLFSSDQAAADLTGLSATYQTGGTITISDYTTALRAFLGQPNALADGAFAYSNRAIGNLARPYYPDGLPGSPQGPLSKPFAQWSPFSTGIQLDLVNDAILQHVVHVISGGVSADVAAGVCTTPARSRLANGIQIFPGSMPIYRGAVLVGAIGVSGDGVDQDDMVSFLGLHEGAAVLGTGLSNAPPAIRADTLTPQGTRLRYVQCPQSPYFASDEQNVCEGK